VASVPPPGPPRDQHAADSAPEVPLPLSTPAWASLLALWPSIGEGLFVDLAATCDSEAPHQWDACSARLVEAGLCEHDPAAERALVVVDPWRPPLDAAFGALVDMERLAIWFSLVVDEAARQALLTGITRWTQRRARWDVLSDLWLVVSRDGAALTDAAVESFVDTPEEARRQYPALTLASAMAAASLAQAPRTRADAFLGRVVLDATRLHADWARRAETDDAVAAGTLRMLGERWLPASTNPLDAAWRTKIDLDAFVDERSREGRPPSRFAQSFFRTMSAVLALVRADLRGSMEEARWAVILADVPQVTEAARAVEMLVRSLSGEVGTEPVDRSEPLPEDFRFGSPGQMAAVIFAIARGHQALQRLDREGVEHSLRVVSADEAAVIGLWAPWASLRAFHAGLWGDPSRGLSQLLADLERQPLAARENDEPAGSVLVGRARESLLSRVGAFGAAVARASALPEAYRVACQARARLWAGESGPTVRIVEAALPSPTLLPTDRQQMLLIRGAATALGGRVPEDIRLATEGAMRVLLETRGYLPLALLPAPARTAILGMSGGLAQDDGTRESFAELGRRLAEINGGGGAKGLFHLTERESVLLPLLASDLTVPEIAARLSVSVNTVRKQVATLREKFEVSTRADLVREARTHGAID